MPLPIALVLALAPVTLPGAAEGTPPAPPTAGSTEPTVIVLPAGRHATMKPLELPADARDIVIDGHGQATLVGGITLEQPAWRAPDAALAAGLPPEARDHVRVLDLPADALRAWPAPLAGPSHAGHGVTVAASPTEVFVGGRALTPARWPNTGWATIERIVDAGSVPRNADPDIPQAQRSNEPPRGGTFVPADRSHLARWSRAEDAWMHGYWNWDWSDELLPLARVDPATGTVTLAAPHRYGLAQRGRFCITNLLEELDAPGECWIDRATARVVAWLPTDLPGADHAPVTVSMLTEPLIRVPGGANAPRVRVRGVAFECTRGAAIAGDGVRDTQVTDCTFRNIGGAGIELSGTGIAVERCALEDVGGTGVTMRGGDRPTLTTSHNRIADCTFTRCGRLQRTYHPAVDIDGVGIEVLRNEISDLPHFAVLYAGNEHRIEANHLHHVCRETGDAGAMYIGRDWTSHGNVVRGNLVHDVAGSDARYQNAFYVDDMSSGITLEDNLVVRCNWGMLIGGGRDMVIRNNAFVACGKAIMFDARGVGWMAPNIADPKTSTLHQRLAAIPVGQEPWRTRYPTLQTYLTDRFGRPANGTVMGNAMMATAPGKIDDREGVQETGTVTLPVPAGTTIEAECERLIRAACTGQVQVGNATLGPVGPSRRP